MKESTEIYLIFKPHQPPQNYLKAQPCQVGLFASQRYCSVSMTPTVTRKWPLELPARKHGWALQGDWHRWEVDVGAGNVVGVVGQHVEGHVGGDFDHQTVVHTR